MLPVTIDDLAGELAGALPPFNLAEQRLAVALYGLLAEGAPVSPDELASAVGIDPDRTREILSRWPNLFRDRDGNVIAFGGLAVRLMDHRFEVDGRSLWTWCAWDALFIPVIIDRAAHVESSDPVSGETVSLAVRPEGIEAVAPTGAVLSFLRPPRFDDDVIRNFCHYVYFFTSPGTAAQWTAEHERTFVLSLEDGFDLGRHWVGQRFGAALAERVG